MSDFPQAGVQLVAADADQFFGQLDRGNQALQQFGQQATQTASQFGVLDAAEARTRENIADLTDKIGLQQRQLGILNEHMEGRDWVLGEGRGKRSVIDAYAFPMIRWAVQVLPEAGVVGWEHMGGPMYRLRGRVVRVREGGWLEVESALLLDVDLDWDPFRREELPLVRPGD